MVPEIDYFTEFTCICQVVVSLLCKKCICIGVNTRTDTDVYMCMSNHVMKNNIVHGFKNQNEIFSLLWSETNASFRPTSTAEITHGWLVNFAPN